MRPSDRAVIVENLTAAYNDTPVLWDISFSLPSASITAILGPNGAGKTTFMKTALGHLKPISGSITYFGQFIKKVRNQVAYVPQKDSVDWDFPITVLEVVLMGRFRKLGFFKWPKRADKEAAMDALEAVGMASVAHSQISELSGGQKQRVFLARAFLQEADVYLLDEPFSGIDATTEAIIIDLFKLLKNQGKTFLIVHHDLQNVRDIFDHVVILNHSLIACGPTQETFTKENLSRAYGKKGELLSEMMKISQDKRTGLVI